MKKSQITEEILSEFLSAQEGDQSCSRNPQLPSNPDAEDLPGTDQVVRGVPSNPQYRHQILHTHGDRKILQIDFFLSVHNEPP